MNGQIFMTGIDFIDFIFNTIHVPYILRKFNHDTPNDIGMAILKRRSETQLLRLIDTFISFCQSTYIMLTFLAFVCYDKHPASYQH